MLQRQLSNSSIGRGGSRASLRRSPSAGSMTTRTFRDRSPGSSPRVHSLDLASHPPMPPLPENVVTNGLGHKRSLSVQPRRVVTSPPPLPSGRGASLDGRPSVSQEQPPLKVERVRGIGEVGRSGSRTSINFSYPMNSPLTRSPIQSPVQRESPYSSPFDSGASQPSSSEHVAEVAHAAEAPGPSEGSHLASKTAMGNNFDDAQAEKLKSSQYSYDTRTTNEQIQSTETSQPVSAEKSENYINGSKAQSTSKARPQQRRWPSTVREEDEADSVIGEPGPAERHSRDDSEVQSSQRFDGSILHGALTIESETMVKNGTSTVRRPRSPSAPTLPSARLNVRGGGEQSSRQSSISPSRSARFANQLVTTDSNALIHEPPSRSMSPAKSAMKQTAPVDARSNSGIRHAQPSIEISDGGSVASDEGSRSGSRKKVPRVSFDDKAEVVGVAASPPTPSEPVAELSISKDKSKSRSSWFPIGKKKASQRTSVDDEDFEPVFSPRPSLPAFGSIRGSRASSGEQSGEGVKGSENHVNGSVIPGSDSSAVRSDSHVESQPGAATLQDISTTVNAGTNTVESTFHPTETQVNERSPVEASNHEPPLVPDSISQAALPASTASKSGNEPSRETSEPPVHINVQPADPMEDRRDSFELRDVPGAFPLGPSDRASSQSKASQIEKASPSAATEPSETQAGPQNAESSDDSGESIYSDAPEIIEGDGFGSINAIVDSPLPSKSLSTVSPLSPATEHDEQAISERAAKEPSPDTSWPLPPAPIVIGSVTAVENNKSNSRPKSAHLKEGSHLQKALDSPASESHTSGNRRSVTVEPDFTLGLPPMTDRLSKTRSNGSDSSSSFKRARRPASRADGQIVMRRTLRDSRPSSPSFDPREPGMRGTRKSTSFGTLRKKSTLSRSSNAASSSRFVSRFADSSDEDEPLESSLRPVRGIPRTYGEHDGDSTDLDDSSDDGLGSHPTKSNLDGYESLRSPPRKGGLLARLTSTSRRGRNSWTGKVRKSDYDSPARRDTHLERSREELRLMKEGTLRLQAGVQNGLALPLDSTQKLNKTNKGASTNGQQAPAKSTMPNDTVNGVSESNGRPGIRSEDPAANDRFAGISEVVIKGGRKRRFPLLRRAFGLRE